MLWMVYCIQGRLYDDVIDSCFRMRIIVCGLSELFSCLSVVYFELICRVSFGVDWWFQIKGADSVF